MFRPHHCHGSMNGRHPHGNLAWKSHVLRYDITNASEHGHLGTRMHATVRNKTYLYYCVCIYIYRYLLYIYILHAAIKWINMNNVHQFIDEALPSKHYVLNALNITCCHLQNMVVSWYKAYSMLMSYRAIYHFKFTHLHIRSATRELQSDRESQFYTATNPGKQCLKPSCPTKSSVCFSLRVLTSLAQRVNISLLISIVHDSKKKIAEIQYDISKHHAFQHSCPLSPLISQGFPPDHRGFGCHGHAIAMIHGRVGSPQCGDAWTAAWPTGTRCTRQGTRQLSRTCCCDDHGKMTWTY